MPYVLIINAAVSLIMGAALVLVWRRDRSQTFTRSIGIANLVQLLVPVTYWWMSQHVGASQLLGAATLSVVAGAYTTLLILGTAHLASRKLPLRSAALLFVAIASVDAMAVVWGGIRMGQAAMGSFNTVVGLLCTYWLWRPAANRSPSEKLVGPLLVLLGLIQFIFVVYAERGVEPMAALGTLLRMTLGLVLLNAALDRSAMTAHRMRVRFERLAERSLQGILISLGDRSIVYANPACLAIYGVKSLESLRVATVARTIPKTEHATVARMIAQIQSGQVGDSSYEAERFKADGSRMWLRFHYFQTEWDDAAAVQVLITDETERHQTSQALAHLALHDDLTGLPNRASMISSLRSRCTPDLIHSGFVLILINLDRFKLFNEAHGPSMGDNVLKAVGQGLREAIPKDHQVMRLAGDEFALISATHGKGDTAVELVSAVQKLLSQPFQVAGQEIFVDASLGIALYPSSARDAESLLRAANAAMHVAKRTPGTSYRLAEKAFERGSSNALEQEQSLRVAIENEEIYLAYQPKVNAGTGRLTSFEALARWSHPELGDISPVDFIAAAERTGLITTLGTALLRRACRQIAAWSKEFGACVPVAVNVSPLQLLDPRFPLLVAKVLEESGVAPELLTLEITESSAVQNLAQTVTQVDQLRAMGVQVAMDDFGTGFSSLNMLRSLHLHAVKIDRGLIDPLPSPDAVAVVRAICQLADALHLHVVAEGVETTAQADAARLAGCGELQGYLFAKPLPPEQAAQWMVSMAETHNADL